MDALDLLSNDNYITVNKTLIKEIGLENAIVFGVLCGYQRGYGTEEFYKEQEKIIDDTGLTEYLVRKSIKELTDLKYILVVKKGMPAKYHYKINIELLTFKILTSSGAKIDTTCGSKNETTNKNNNKNELNNINNISKEKENIKENESSIVGEIAIPDKLVKDFTEKAQINKIFKFWNELGIIKHTKLNEARIKAIKKRLEDYSYDEIISAMNHYVIILHDENYYWNYTWSLEDFLNRKNGFTTFLDDGSNWVSYTNRNKNINNNNNPYSRQKEISKETAYPNQKNKGYI